MEEAETEGLFSRGKARVAEQRIDSQRFEIFRLVALSLPLIKNSKLEPGEWDCYEDNREMVARQMHLLDQACANPDYQTDAMRILDCLTELLVFEDGKPFSEELAKVYRKNFDLLESAMQNGTHGQKIIALKVAARFAVWKDRRKGFPMSKRPEMQFLQKHSGEIWGGFEQSLRQDSGDDFREYLEPMAVLLEYGDRAAATGSREALMRSVNNRHYNPNSQSPEFRFGLAAEVMARGLWDKKYTELDKIVSGALDGYGLDFRDFKRGLVGNKKQHILEFGFRYADGSGKELVKLGQLEAQRPGIVGFYSPHLPDSNYVYTLSDKTLIEHYDSAINNNYPYENEVRSLASLPQWDRETAERLVKVWTQNQRINMLRSIELSDSNLAAVQELEAEVPGITLTLNREFKIYDFARYPKELMVAQYNQRNNRDIPYGVVIYPHSDWNGAFYQDKNTFGKFLTQLGGRYALRIMETDSVTGLIRGLIRLNGKYFEDRNGGEETGHKISFAILGGHGEKNSIDFGQSEHDGKMYKKYLFGPGAPKVKKYFEDHPDLVLVSCSTGKKRGVAQILSRVLEANLIAPDKPTSLTGLEATFDDNGQLQIKAEYSHENTQVTYSVGREIKPK